MTNESYRDVALSQVGRDKDADAGLVEMANPAGPFIRLAIHHDGAEADIEREFPGLKSG